MNQEIFSTTDENGVARFSQFGSQSREINEDNDRVAKKNKEARKRIQQLENPDCASNNPPDSCVFASPEIVESIEKSNRASARISDESDSAAISDPAERIRLEREAYVSRLRSEGQLIQDTSNVVLGIVSPPLGYFEAAQNIDSLITFVRENPEITVSAATVTACAAVSKCRFALKQVRDKVITSKKSRNSDVLQKQQAVQQFNKDLFENLINSNPNASKREILNLAKGKLKVSNIPLGFTEDSFNKGLRSISETLSGFGVGNASGFATGSRVLGVKANPKKNLGTPINPSSTSDFDITLTLTESITNEQQKVLKNNFLEATTIKLGVKVITDERELKFKPIFGKIDLDI